MEDWLNSPYCGEMPVFVGKKNYLCARNKQKTNFISEKNERMRENNDGGTGVQ